eukprot:297393-Pelagomonas_calceolata.AAC.3
MHGLTWTCQRHICDIIMLVPSIVLLVGVTAEARGQAMRHTCNDEILLHAPLSARSKGGICPRLQLSCLQEWLLKLGAKPGAGAGPLTPKPPFWEKPGCEFGF